MTVIKVKGTHFECGLKIGRRMAKEIKQRMRDLNINGNTYRRHKKTLQMADKICRKKYPVFVEEIEGMAVGAKQTYLSMLHVNVSELVRNERCSSVVFSNGKEVILAHNEDGLHDKKELCALVHYELPHVSFHSFFYAGEMPGSSFVWNSNGVFYTVNYVLPFSFDYPHGAVPRVFVARDVIESKSSADAIQKIKNSFCASGYHYYIGDLKHAGGGAKIFSVEQYRKRICIEKVKEFDSHTNHYIHKSFPKYAGRTKNSSRRLERLKELAANKRNWKKEEICANILFDKTGRPYPIFGRKGDFSRTLATAVFEPSRELVTIYKKDSLKDSAQFKMSRK